MADDDRRATRRLGGQDPAFVAPNPNAPQSTAQKVFVSVEFFLLSLAAQAFAFFRPFVPYLVPLAVSLAVLPVLAFFSFLAGYVVWKSSAVTWEHPLYLQYGDGVPPYSDIRLNVAANQPYDVNLQLVVPDLPSNFALGNFMASISIATLSNRTLVTSRRPSIVLPPTTSVIPFWNRKNTVGVTVPLLVDQTIGASRVLAHIEVGRRDSWKGIGNGEGRELSVLSATLQGIVKHQGLRGLFTRNPLLAGYIASGSFFILSAIVVFGFLVNATSLFTPYQYELVDATPYGKDIKRSKSQEALEERVARRRRGSSKHSAKSFEDVKEEVQEATIPDAEDWETPLRRRSARGLADEQNE